jgi:hypothetical protein
LRADVATSAAAAAVIDPRPPQDDELIAVLRGQDDVTLYRRIALQVRDAHER